MSAARSCVLAFGVQMALSHDYFSVQIDSLSPQDSKYLAVARPPWRGSSATGNTVSPPSRPGLRLDR